ncbi:MAG: phage baseplate assembly protein V [Elainella sp. Prado103]|jgi:hypothetical protein|nr:phage baseplate assembly protein V [Elainella sp. Prado103]
MTKAEVSWDIVASSGDDEEESGKKFYGVTTGIVVDVTDPLGLGRVQVQLAMMTCGDVSAWARVATPMAGSSLIPSVAGYGFYFIPEIGTEVLVVFENGDMNHPFVIGCLWNSLPPAARPPVPSPLAGIRGIRTTVGSQVVFSDLTSSIFIQNGPTLTQPSIPSPVGPSQTIALTPDGINMTGTSMKVLCGATSFIVTPTSITMQAGGSTLAVTPDGIVMTAPQISIFGAQVRIN